MSNPEKNIAIILASGKGSRFGANIPKQFVEIKGRTLLERSLEAFENNKDIDEIILVITPEYKERGEEIISKAGYKKITKILPGGELRKDSSAIGINSIEEDEANLLIHDCARALVTDKLISGCVEALKKYKAANVAIPVTDTILKVKDDIIESIPQRSEYMLCQTPQCFKLSLIKEAHKKAQNDPNFTDDCGLIMKYNPTEIHIVKGDAENIKITYPGDLHLAEEIIKSREKQN